MLKVQIWLVYLFNIYNIYLKKSNLLKYYTFIHLIKLNIGIREMEEKWMLKIKNKKKKL